MNRLIRFLTFGVVGLILAALASAEVQAAPPSAVADQVAAASDSGDRPLVAQTRLPPVADPPDAVRPAPPPARVRPTPTPQRERPAPPPPSPRVIKKPPPPRERVVRKPPTPRRPIELHQKFPIKRPPRETILRRRRPIDRIPPVLFLPPVFFGGVVIDDRRNRYVRDRLAWADSETLYRDEDWVEIVLDCNARGEKLWFEVRDGRVRIDWAEIVFENGEAQVVDFSERSIGPGLYVLMDFRDGRRVDHVRMVAQATSRQARLILRMEQ